jgi:hypothetical protein
VKAGVADINSCPLNSSSAYVNNEVISGAQPKLPYTFLLPYAVTLAPLSRCGEQFTIIRLVFTRFDIR